MSVGLFARVDQWLWNSSLEGKSRVWRVLQRVGQVAWYSVASALENRLPFQASALTFTTLLGMVPALALVFALAKGFGFAESLRNLLIESLSDYQRDIFDRVLGYVENTKVGTLGAVGLLLTLVTVITTIASVEDTFNHIWHVREQRPWSRRFTDYLSILVVVPLLVLAGSVMWAGLASTAFISWLQEVAVVGEITRFSMRFVPLLALCAAFTFLYTYLPNTRVPVRSALIAAAVTSVLWWAVQTIYIKFQVGVAKYNAIYGGFASLPLFMVWLQVSWTIVLFGGQLAHAHSLCSKTASPPKKIAVLSPLETEIVGLRLVELVAKRFDAGQPLPTVESAATVLGAPRQAFDHVLEALAHAGVLVIERETGIIRPSRSLDRITLADVVLALRNPSSAHASNALASLLHETEQERLRRLASVNLLELVRKPPE